MIECYGIVSSLIDKKINNDPNCLIIKSHKKEHINMINQVVLKKKRKIEELDDLFDDKDKSNNENDDLFNFDWRSKGLN